MGNMMGKLAGLKGKLLKIKIIAIVSVAGFFIILLMAVAGYLTSYPQAMIDKASKAASEFFEKVGNLFLYFNFSTTEDIFKDSVESARVKYGLHIDIPLLSSALTIENQGLTGYTEQETRDFYKARLEKVNIDIGLGNKGAGFPSTTFDKVSYIDALAYSMVGYYDIECELSGNNWVCSDPVYETTYNDYILYEVPGIDSDFDKQSETSLLVKQKTKKIDGEEVVVYDWTRYYFFSYQKFLYFLEKTYLPHFHNDVINKDGVYDEVLVKSMLRRTFYRREDTIYLFYRGEDEGTESGFINVTLPTVSDNDFPSNIAGDFTSPLGSSCGKETSCFGYYSASPGQWYCQAHHGLDMALAKGTPLYSIGKGTVVYVARNNTNCIATCNCTGNQVHIRYDLSVDGENSEGKITSMVVKYLHMNSIASGVAVDATVEKGQNIGEVGNTGCSTGDHLHFEMIDQNNELINPEEFFSAIGCSSAIDTSCNSIRATCDTVRGK